MVADNCTEENKGNMNGENKRIKVKTVYNYEVCIDPEVEFVLIQLDQIEYKKTILKNEYCTTK